MPLTEETHTAMTSGPMTTFETSSEPLPAPLGPSVASLLSQLQGSTGPSAATGGGRAPPAQVEPPSTSAPGPSPPATASAPPPAAPGRPLRPHSGGIGPSSGPSVDAAGPVRQAGPPRPLLDVRTCTFQQALPHLARLAEDPEFLKALTAVRPGFFLPFISIVVVACRGATVREGGGTGEGTRRADGSHLGRSDR